MTHDLDTSASYRDADGRCMSYNLVAHTLLPTRGRAYL